SDGPVQFRCAFSPCDAHSIVSMDVACFRAQPVRLNRRRQLACIHQHGNVILKTGVVTLPGITRDCCNRAATSTRHLQNKIDIVNRKVTRDTPVSPWIKEPFWPGRLSQLMGTSTRSEE